MFAALRPAAALVSVIVLGGCATLTVSSHVERGLDVTRYRTYDWGPADALPTGDPRLDNNPFFKDRLQGAVERHLSAKGLSLASGGRADLLIHYHASVTQRLDVAGVDYRYGYTDPQPNVVEYEQGTIVLDVVDVRTKRVIWRAWAQGSLSGFIDDQRGMERRIDEAVTKMMKAFPFEVRSSL
jgi:hypothetical protein